MPAQAFPDPASTGDSPLGRPLNIGRLGLANRLVALPVFSGYAYPDGQVSPLLLDRYRRLGESGAGLVVVANVGVSADGLTSRHNLRGDGDEYLPGLAKLARTIKSGGAAAGLQLNHAGRFAKTDRALLPSSMDGSHLGFDLGSLKAFMEFFPLEHRFGLTQDFLARVTGWTRPMTDEECARVIADFGRAAERAVAAGFDLIELHGASGYLLTQFLSAYTNRRNDEYGGDFDRRAEFVGRVVAEIRRRVGPDIPIGFRLLLREWVPEGIDLPEALDLAQKLEAWGVSYLSATAATHNSLFSPKIQKLTARPGYLAADTAALKARVRLPVIVSGRIISQKQAAKILNDGAADLIGLGRTLVADIEWVQKTVAGGKPRACINCWRCLKRVTLDKALTCVRWPDWLRQRIEVDQALLRRDLNRMLVVLAGETDVRWWRDRLGFLIPPRPGISVDLLFVKPTGQGDLTGPEIRFVELSRRMWSARAQGGGRLEVIVSETDDEPEGVVLDEAGRGGHGVIWLSARREDEWRTRLVYRQQERVVGLLGPGERPEHVLVAVDFSDASLLALRYLGHSWMIAPGVKVTFVHVLDGPSAEAQDRWVKVRKVLGWDEDFKLSLVTRQDGLAETLLDIIQRAEFGTVIMGKRGLSGIKRFLLGSVSAGVLKGLTDQTLILVD
jgi:2,4-dienoyl-CoA reductase-like NADH-dependent reductase (Old Yellow Enzyme family)/nucleotide-binding universal stress UspA family protein